MKRINKQVVNEKKEKEKENAEYQTLKNEKQYLHPKKMKSNILPKQS